MEFSQPELKNEFGIISQLLLGIVGRCDDEHDTTSIGALQLISHSSFCFICKGTY